MEMMASAAKDLVKNDIENTTAIADHTRIIAKQADTIAELEDLVKDQDRTIANMETDLDFLGKRHDEDREEVRDLRDKVDVVQQQLNVLLVSDLQPLIQNTY